MADRGRGKAFRTAQTEGGVAGGTRASADCRPVWGGSSGRQAVGVCHFSSAPPTSRPTSYPGIAATLVFSHIPPGRLWAPTWISARASWLTSLPEPTADRRRWTPRLRFLSRASPRGPLSNVHFCWLPSSSVSLPRPHPPAPWDAFPNDGSTKPLPQALLAGTPRLKRAANVLLKNLSFVLRTQKIRTFPR